MKKYRTVSLLSIAMLFLTHPLAAEQTLIFGTYTADKPSATVKKFKPFLNFLAAKLTAEIDEPVVIKMAIAKTYEDGIQQLVDGRVDFSRFGPASYIVAKDANDGIQIIAMESQKGLKTFKGVIAVHKDNEMSSLSELRGHKFAFGDELSTIGRYLAQQHLLQAGITADDLESFEYLGRHDRVGAAVGNKKFEAGAMKSSTFEKMQKKSVPIKSLFEFDNVTKPWIASSKMSPKIVEAMQGIMLTSKNDPAVQTMSKSGFLNGADSDFDTIRRAIEQSASF
jgi:phosphonate transport system substrate-binding protein